MPVSPMDAKRGKKRKTSVLDVLVKDYADAWEKWDTYLSKEEVDVDSRSEIFDHLKGYKKKMDTWPSKERRKAFRAMYRRYRPMLQSGSLTMTSIGSIESPLALPQIETGTPPLAPMLSGIDDQIEAAEISGVVAGLVLIARSLIFIQKGKEFTPPSFLTIHQRYRVCINNFSSGVIKEFSHCDSHDDHLLFFRRLIDTDVNYLVNTTGGHIALGLDPATNIVKGYPIGRKLRDQIRLLIDTQMAQWQPPPLMLNLVEVKFVEIRSQAKIAIQGHFAVWISAKPAAGKIKNSKGEIIKTLSLTKKNVS
eukprot:TRINITY_DN4652_c2_g1_i1.p1 TRINITY_DN4652_c2_g1~~TRINITY_DN4652_c2_g1_i1.p1  ORF type:complete len:308 (+),score=50.42 TRINITY_DN4652_c2_g1_i1:125-1048(+)